MTIKHIVAIVVVFVTATLGWTLLGSSSVARSVSSESQLGQSVLGLWGKPVVQGAPLLSVRVPGSERVRQVLPTENRIETEIVLEPRKKGLLWYPTFTVDFTASYTITNPDPIPQKLRLFFPLPSKTATYEQFKVWLDGTPLEASVSQSEGIREILALAPGETRQFKVSYRTRGLREWRYRLAEGTGRVKGLDIVARTNFPEVDFPEGALSPMRIGVQEDGKTLLRWTAEDLITTQDVGVTMPQRLNPGPLAARMSFFAPVCLLFFFVLLTAIAILRKIEVHPMHYLFVAAGFFAFHLLFAYLVDLVDVHIAFAVAALTSVTLVTLYLRAALGPRFPAAVSAAGQLLYLVLFSYSFFLQGMTGLTVTIGSVITLAVLMKLTTRVRWQEVFGATVRA